jgi:uncharacterized protein (TIGR02444 family)
VLEINNPFWQFSLRIYAAEGVKDECLALQDVFHININVLLFAAWLGVQRGIVLNAKDFALLETKTNSWSEAVVQPLRRVRRYLKPFRSREGEHFERLARQTGHVELEAERIEQAMFFALAESHWPTSFRGSLDAARANVKGLIARHAAGDPTTQQYPAIQLIQALALQTADGNADHDDWDLFGGGHE